VLRTQIRGSRSEGETLLQENRTLLQVLGRLQQGTHPATRATIARLVVQAVNDVVGPPVEDSALADKVAAPASELSEVGFTRLGQLLETAQVEDIAAWLSGRPVFNGHSQNHSDLVPRRIGDGAEAHFFGCYSQDDIYGAPHLFELANHPLVLAIAGKYLGCIPTLYSMNLWWVFSGHPNPPAVTHQFHRDFDDFKWCTLFCYLTDVRIGAGEQEFVRFSHRYDLIRQRKKLDKAQLDRLFTETGYKHQDGIDDLFKDDIVVIEGPAGSAILADTLGYHRGVPPTTGHRLMFWARYGLYANPTTMVGSGIGRHRTRLKQRLSDRPFVNYINRVYLGPLPRLVFDH